MERRLDYRSLIIAADNVFDKFDGDFKRIVKYLENDPPMPASLAQRIKAVIAFRLNGDAVSVEDKFHLLVDTGLLDMIYDSKRIAPDVALFFAAIMGRSNIIDELNRRTGTLTRFDTAMAAAAERGHLDIVLQIDTMMKARRLAGLDLPAPKYRAIAKQVARLGRLDAVRLLLAIAPDDRVVDDILMGAMMAATMAGRSDILNYALSHGGREMLIANVLHLMCGIFGVGMIIVILQNGLIFSIVFFTLFTLIFKFWIGGFNG